MTLTIPVWLLTSAKVALCVLAVLGAIALCFFAWLGWNFYKAFK